MGVAYQVNPETNEWTPVTHPASALPHNAYDVIADSQNNMYGINMDKEHIWWTDAKTLETKFYSIPTAELRQARQCRLEGSLMVGSV